ncbi:hypothetical protein BaRGS_00035634 [Batillaria attramentaria]|uniref:PHD-type domain-containing protein n=1 Tax=Batillaria attramentaria TaxID=370345 RepID=A0ABD0JE89_9CAEN
MSRSDLDAIQTKLKTAIQSHQMLVMKIKNEPQNAAMKDKLHELQAEIRNLSNEQHIVSGHDAGWQGRKKSMAVQEMYGAGIYLIVCALLSHSEASHGCAKALVEELREELMQNAKVSTAATVTTAATTTGVLAQPTIPTIGQPRLVALPPQGATILPMGVVVPLAHVQARPTLVAFQGILNQPADLTLKDQQQQQFVMNIQCSTNSVPITAATTTINNNIAPKPVVSTVKQPQPTVHERPIQPRRTSPPIKVPQYPVNQSRTTAQQGQAKTGSASNNGYIHRSLSESDAKTLKKNLEPEVKDVRRVVDTKNLSLVERRKMEFMASLDLVTPGALKELQSRRVERKRRSTANPQFSYTFELERRRGSSWLDGMQSAIKRPRGRPPKTSPSPSSSQPGSPGSPDDLKMDRNGAMEDDSHESVCAECSKGGELLMCSTCPLVYHLDCLSPPLATVPPGPWSCPACIVKGKGLAGLTNGALSMVHSYIASKTSKEEEKRKLQRKNTELLNEKSSLQEKAQHLKEQIQDEKAKGERLEEVISQKTQDTSTITNFIKSFQTSVAPVPVPETTA